MKTEKFRVTGMTCAACEANVTRTVRKLPGVNAVEVSLLAGHMRVTYEEAQLKPRDICAAVVAIGYGASEMEKEDGHSTKSDNNGFRRQWESRQAEERAKTKAMRTRLWTSLLLLVPLMAISMGHMVGLPLPPFLEGSENALLSAFTQFLITIPVLMINRHFFTNGIKALQKRVPNMDSLVAVGAGASFLYGVFAIYRMIAGLQVGDAALVAHYSHSLYFESAAMILALVTVGKYLETRSKAKTSDALGKLVDLAPKTATVYRDGQEIVIPAEQVVVDDIVVIRPGESIPVDGVVTEGSGFVDEAAVTGESMPVEKTIGANVISASINKNGTFRFRASRVGEDTTLSQIIRLVDEASSSKAPIARLADRVAGVFVPAVIAIAFLVAVIWLIAGENFEFALNCAVSVLVISCPCALGLATPVAIMVGTGRAALSGILIKSAETLEKLHTADTVVLDKTGTLTAGHPSVTDVILLDSTIDRTAFLADAALTEAGSEHPLAEAVIRKAQAEGIAVQSPAHFTMTAGRGVMAEDGENHYLGGNAQFLAQAGVGDESGEVEEQAARLAAEGKTPLLFAKNGKLTGIIAVADTPRPESKDAIAAFQALGLRVQMLTGDRKATAQAIGAQLGIADTIAEVLPGDKESCVRRLQEQGRRVIMVGDGINDAPALTRADIGIAIGAGTDIAMDAADVVLMKSSLSDVATAVRLSRAVVRNIRMNLFWAFFYNICGIPLAAGALYPAFGLLLSPMIGAAAMSLSSVCVVTNALRLRFFKDVPSPRAGSLSAKSDVPPTAHHAGAADSSAQSNNIDKKEQPCPGTACAAEKSEISSLEDTSHSENLSPEEVPLEGDIRTLSAQSNNIDKVEQPCSGAACATEKSEISPLEDTSHSENLSPGEVPLQRDHNQHYLGGNQMKKILVVEGMMCAHCQARVEKALAAVEGVTEAKVDLESKTAAVTLSEEVANATLSTAVEEAGYTVLSVTQA